MLQAVIFDFDGVITDSEILHLRSFNEVLSAYDVEITIRDYYQNYLGLTDMGLFTLLIEKHTLKVDSAELENLLMKKNQVFERLADMDGRIIEGVRDFLNLLKQNNITIAICSGALTAEIELTLEQAKLRSFFKVIVSADQVKHGKPSPEGYLLALEKLNQKNRTPVLGNQCVVIEDSHWGLEAARAAGMHTIAVTNSYDAEQLSMAEKITTNLKDLTIADLKDLCS